LAGVAALQQLVASNALHNGAKIQLINVESIGKYLIKNN
jgi:hypothetical protein